MFETEGWIWLNRRNSRTVYNCGYQYHLNVVSVIVVLLIYTVAALRGLQTKVVAESSLQEPGLGLQQHQHHTRSAIAAAIYSVVTPHSSQTSSLLGQPNQLEIHISNSQMADLRSPEPHASEIEKNIPAAFAFHNGDVKTLTWEDLSVKVVDRTTGADKYILSAVSGHVRAGMLYDHTSFADPDAGV